MAEDELAIGVKEGLHLRRQRVHRAVGDQSLRVRAPGEGLRGCQQESQEDKGWRLGEELADLLAAKQSEIQPSPPAGLELVNLCHSTLRRVAPQPVACR